MTHGTGLHDAKRAAWLVPRHAGRRPARWRVACL